MAVFQGSWRSGTIQETMVEFGDYGDYGDSASDAVSNCFFQVHMGPVDPDDFNPEMLVQSIFYPSGDRLFFPGTHGSR